MASLPRLRPRNANRRAAYCHQTEHFSAGADNARKMVRKTRLRLGRSSSTPATSSTRSLCKRWGGTFTVMKESWPRGCRLAARADTRRFQQPFTLVFMALAEWWPPNKAGSTESVPQVRRMQRGHGAKRRTRLQCSRRTHWALANSTPGHLAMFEHAPLSDTWWCGIRRAARVQSGRGR
jgi:hypothetical protein